MPEATYFSDTAKQLNSGLTAKTASTYAATDLIQLYANDGTPNGKISRSDLMEAVKASLPSLLSDQSTNAANILTMIADGTLGKTTAANLASILGVFLREHFGSTNGLIGRQPLLLLSSTHIPLWQTLRQL